MYYPDGKKYEGEWVDNKYEGKGKINYPNGAWYEGDFVASKYHGFGKLMTERENLFEG